MADNDASTRGIIQSPPEVLLGLIDDAAIYPPGNVPLDEAVRAHFLRRDTAAQPLVGTFVIGDHRLADLKGLVTDSLAVSIVIGAGAGGIAPALSVAHRIGGVTPAAVEIALRDTDDLVGNARRVVAAVNQARDLGLLDDDVAVYVELPQGEATHGWLGAADEVAGAELRLKLRTGGVEEHLFPSTAQLGSWITAALDRETPFKCTAGLHRAARHTGEDGITHHGFLNVLLATRASLDGADPSIVQGVLEERDAERLAADARESVGLDALARTRRWFISFGSCSIDEPEQDLRGLGLL
ncbi:hypothetical protein NODU109028_12200 [Nocardioides dubius]|uniref:Uncharacterized protein n=1 Tax=Nocardioides dubius TaxID=317019 RepID=A0ABP4ECL2_9ACTN